MFLKEIDDYIVQAKERSYETMVNFGKQGLSIAATAAVSAAVKASVCVGDRQTEWERAVLNTVYLCFWYAGLFCVGVFNSVNEASWSPVCPYLKEKVNMKWKWTLFTFLLMQKENIVFVIFHHDVINCFSSKKKY